jgi:hypothetical protein
MAFLGLPWGLPEPNTDAHEDNGQYDNGSEQEGDEPSARRTHL